MVTYATYTVLPNRKYNANERNKSIFIDLLCERKSLVQPLNVFIKIQLFKKLKLKTKTKIGK